MGVLIPVGYGQATLPFYSTSFPRPFAITWGFDAPPSPNLVTIANAMISNLGGTGGWFQPTTVRSDVQIGPVIIQIQDETGIISGSGSTAISGTATVGNRIPPNVAYLVQKRSALGGRRNRGRWYVPTVNVTEDEVDNAGNLTTTKLTDLQTRVDLFRTLEQTDGRSVYVLHSAPGAPALCNATTVQRLMATQRRRLRS